MLAAQEEKGHAELLEGKLTEQADSLKKEREEMESRMLGVKSSHESDILRLTKLAESGKHDASSVRRAQEDLVKDHARELETIRRERDEMLAEQARVLKKGHDDLLENMLSDHANSHAKEREELENRLSDRKSAHENEVLRLTQLAESGHRNESSVKRALEDLKEDHRREMEAVRRERDVMLSEQAKASPMPDIGVSREEMESRLTALKRAHRDEILQLSNLASSNQHSNVNVMRALEDMKESHARELEALRREKVQSYGRKDGDSRPSESESEALREIKELKMDQARNREIEKERAAEQELARQREENKRLSDQIEALKLQHTKDVQAEHDLERDALAKKGREKETREDALKAQMAAIQEQHILEMRELRSRKEEEERDQRDHDHRLKEELNTKEEHNRKAAEHRLAKERVRARKDNLLMRKEMEEDKARREKAHELELRQIREKSKLVQRHGAGLEARREKEFAIEKLEAERIAEERLAAVQRAQREREEESIQRKGEKEDAWEREEKKMAWEKEEMEKKAAKNKEAANVPFWMKLVEEHDEVEEPSSLFLIPRAVYDLENALANATGMSRLSSKVSLADTLKSVEKVETSRVAWGGNVEGVGRSSLASDLDSSVGTGVELDGGGASQFIQVAMPAIQPTPPRSHSASRRSKALMELDGELLHEPETDLVVRPVSAAHSVATSVASDDSLDELTLLHRKNAERYGRMEYDGGNSGSDSDEEGGELFRPEAGDELDSLINNKDEAYGSYGYEQEHFQHYQEEGSRVGKAQESRSGALKQGGYASIFEKRRQGAVN
jgi:hypothetical protein